MSEKVYLEISGSSEKRGMWFITCFRELTKGLMGYLSNSGKICNNLDRKLTGLGNYGTYFNSEEEALECISKFYIVEKKVD